MRSRLTAFLVVLLLLVACSVSYAQGDKDKFKERYDTNAANIKYDPHDLSGMWTMTKLDHTFSTPPPPLTPAGVAAAKGRIGDTTGVPREMANAARAAGAIRIADGKTLDANGPWLE